jgi:glycosyltransferase involved in cell wall biosynthesis
MRILHWLRHANSGLVRTTLEIAKAEELNGHQVTVRQPSDGRILYGEDVRPDVHAVHSQIPQQCLFNGVPKFLWAHAEPLHSIGNGASMEAILDLAPKADAMICMRPEEQAIWQQFLRSYVVPKGIDLDVFKPAAEPPADKLPGSPSILYYENWRGERNPLYWLVAMAEVYQKLPEAKIHLFNCPDGEMGKLFFTMLQQNKWTAFTGSLCGPEEDVPRLISRADIVVSSVFPLYARSIEALGCGKPLICPGYGNPGSGLEAYPWTCRLDPGDMADTIVDCWEHHDKLDARLWAEEHHDVRETARQAVEIYERYIR